MPAEENLLDRLMNEYGDDILRVCYLYLKDYHLAEDAVQETFIRAMRSYGSFGHRSKEKTWLTRIAVNCSAVNAMGFPLTSCMVLLLATTT